MIHRIDPQSEWDRRYAANQKKLAKQAEAKLPKVKKKPGPKPGTPMPKKKRPVVLPATMPMISLKLQGYKDEQQ